MQIGCHLSIGKGFGSLIRRAHEVGADVVQYFPKNPKSYRPKAFDAEAYRREAATENTNGLLTVCHSPYVTNLSSNKEDLRRLTVASIVNDLEIAEAYGTRYLVVHCGKHVGEGESAGEQAMIDALNEILERYTGETLVLLENTAGQGSELGTTIEAILRIHGQLDQPKRVGVCFDTCHAFAAGELDFDNWDRFLNDFLSPEFFDLVKVIHLNDSKVGFGERRDRHELLGQGAIGPERLTQFLTQPQLAHLPVVIETPVDDELQYADEIKTVRDWIRTSTT